MIDPLSIVPVLFADQGRVYKIVQWYDDEGESFSVLLDVFDVTSNEPIRAMAISRVVSSSCISTG